MINKKTKLSLTTEFTTITVEFDNIDVDLDQYFEAFKTLMIGATYSEIQIDNFIINQAEILNNNIKDN